MKRWLGLISLCLGVMTAFAQGGDGGPQAGNRLFNDDFATFVNRWSATDTTDVQVGYEAQALHMRLLTADVSAISLPNNARPIPRFQIQTTLSFVDASAADSFGGILFGYQNDANFYVFGIHPTGHYEVRLRQNDAWAEHPLVRGYFPPTDDSTTYRLSVQYDAGRYWLVINDEPLVPFYDDQLQAGQFGLYGSTTSAAAHLVFDDYVVYDLVYGDGTPASTPTPNLDATPTPSPTLEPTLTPVPSPTPIPVDDADKLPPPRI